jgi:hypothetical protein
VRPAGVVLLAEVLDHDAGFGEGPELFAVEALVAESAVKALHEAILPGAAGINVNGADALLRQPALDGVSDGLWVFILRCWLRIEAPGDGFGRVLHPSTKYLAKQ